MAHHVDRHQRAYEAKQHAVLDTYRRYGRLTPSVLAHQELVDARLAEAERCRRFESPRSGPGPVRRWFAGWLISLGSRLNGVSAGENSGYTSPEEPAPAHAKT